ncbi:MAG TPA: BPSL0067 family protein [Candidatus Angelobacter sp.]|jgi:hypothetical protein
MSWVIHDPLRYTRTLHKPLGSGECAALPIALNRSIPHEVAHWQRGAQVVGNVALAPGTVIAIFNKNLDYQGSHFATVRSFGIAHVALYIAQTANGIEVVHQNQTKGQITRSFIFFGGGRPGDHQIKCDDHGYYSLGTTKSGTILRWRDMRPGDPSYHWGVSRSLRLMEDDANNYYVVELKPKTFFDTLSAK